MKKLVMKMEEDMRVVGGEDGKYRVMQLKRLMGKVEREEDMTHTELIVLIEMCSR